MRVRHFATIGLVSLVALALGAESALAGQIFVGPSIRGSGSITSGTYTCGPVAGVNGSAFTCPIFVTGAFGVLDTTIVVLTATPHPLPAGQWAFSSWVDCPDVAGNQCILRYTGNLASSFGVAAVFLDAVPPVVAAPAATHSTMTERTVDLSWAVNEASTSACSIDSGAFTACGSPLTVSLPEGLHTLRVQATDASGNVGPVSTALAFRIVDTALVGAPSDVSNVSSPTFAFSTLAGSGFDCSTDGGPFADCGTGGPGAVGFTTLANLADGTHTFSVRAKNGSDFDRLPATRTWTVDTKAPSATLTAGPAAGSTQAATTATFAFAASEPGTTECSLDDAPFTACASPDTVSRLRTGAHTFRVRATDRAGNVGTPVARSWKVGSGDTLAAAGTNAITKRVRVLLAFAGTAARDSTWFTKLQVKEVPSGSTVQVTCSGAGCPSGLKGKGYTKKKASGTVTLARFIKKPIMIKARLTFLVSKPGSISAVKILELRPAKSPLLTTRCLMPGAKVSIAC